MKKYTFQLLFALISCSAFSQPTTPFNALNIFPADLNSRFSISGNVVTISGQFSLLGADDEFEVSVSPAQVYTVNDYQSLCLDISGAVYDGVRWELDQTDISVKNATAVTENDVVLLTYNAITATTPDYIKWSGLAANKLFFTAITNSNNWVMLNSNIGSNIKIENKGQKVIMTGPVEIFAKDGNAIKIVADSYPHYIVPAQARVFVLHTDSSFTISGAYHQYNISKCYNQFYNAIRQDKEIPLLIYSSVNNAVSGGVLFQYNQVVKEEKKEVFGSVILSNAAPVSDARAQYAHDSHTFVAKNKNRLYQIVTWQQDRYTTSEWAPTSECMIKVVDLTSQEEVLYASLCKKSTDYKNGITTGASGMVIPRMWPIGTGDTIRIAFSNYTNCYYRDLSLNDMSLSLPQKMQIKIKGGTVMDWDSVAVRIHLDSLFGPDTSFFDLAPLVRGSDQVQVESGLWYMTFEGYPTSNPGGAGIPIMGVSQDSGRTWQLRGAIYDGSLSAGGGCPETSMVWLNSKWNALTRVGGRLHYSSSTDNGNTWSTPVEVDPTNLSTKETRHSAFKTITASGDTVVLIAYQSGNDITGHRTKMGLCKTSDYESFEVIALADAQRSAHYPSIALFAGKLYGSFTTSLKNSTESDRDCVMRFQIDIGSLGKLF